MLMVTNQIAVVHGYDGPYAGTVLNITELGFPTLRLQDGPQAPTLYSLYLLFMGGVC